MKKTTIIILIVAVLVAAAIYFYFVRKKNKDNDLSKYYDPETGYWHDPGLSGTYYDSYDEFMRDRQLRDEAYKQGRTCFWQGKYLTPEEYKDILENIT